MIRAAFSTLVWEKTVKHTCYSGIICVCIDVFLRIIKNAPNVCFVKEHTIFHSWQMLGEQNGEGRGCYYRFFRLRQSLVPKCGEDDPGETRMESQITQEFSYKQ